ncbi:MAG: HD domain-containing protein [Planctomycetota bacterium]
MTNGELDGLRSWFQRLVQTYASDVGRLPPLLQLKVDHSERVAHDSQSLAQEMGWNSSDVHVAEATGWLHDVGRFSQFAEFGTFSDRRSVDHGQRGWKVLKESNVLANLDGKEKDAILTSVRYHNARTIPDHTGSRVNAYLKLVRDADKLDIFRIVHDSVQRDGFQELPDMLPQVQLNGPLSPVLVEELETRRCASLEHVRSLSDFLLMQLSWVYDINYSATFNRIVQRDIVSNIAGELLGESRGVRGMVQAAEGFVREHACRC